MTKPTNFDAMAFYHPDGMVPAWKHATAFGGDKGRVATLPDIIGARLAHYPKTGSTAWDSYFTTSSAEYMGVSKGGNRILIVAHGVGPMSTLDGILQAYSYQFKDKERNRKGGRISQAEFLKLESGQYGDVSVVELDPLMARYEYAFYEYLRLSQALVEPLVAARLGPQFAEYLEFHAKASRERRKLQCGREDEALHFRHGDKAPGKSDPFLLKMGGSRYEFAKLDDGQALAHLLSIGQISNVGHSSKNVSYDSFANDVGLHDWTDGTRLAGVRSKEAPARIHPGADRIWTLFASKWEQLMKPVSEPVQLEFTSIIPVGDQWFTQYPKQGVSMDSGAGEFLVTKMEEVEGPKTFTCEIPGYEMFFRYAVKDVQAIAPAGANAFSIGAIGMGGKGHVAGITWYRIEADTTRRLRTSGEVYNDFELLMKVLGSK